MKFDDQGSFLITTDENGYKTKFLSSVYSGRNYETEVGELNQAEISSTLPPLSTIDSCELFLTKNINNIRQISVWCEN